VNKARSTLTAVTIALVAILVSACAGDVAKPVVIKPFEPAQRSNLHLSEITAEAKLGVVMIPAEFDRIIQRIKAEIAAQSPTMIVAPNAPSGASAANMKLIFTQYDRGNAFARFMIAGAGQIKIDADVTISDPTTGQTIGQFQVSKQFAFGGIYGGSTKIEDVEEGFAKSVAAILTDKKI
jgi:hypothetical protein